MPVLAFFIAMVVPWQFYVGSVHLTSTRAVLLVALIPAILKWVTGKAGGIRMPDVAVLLFIAWCAIATAQIHGLEYAIESAGMLLIETGGAYFLARSYIRSEQDFLATCRALFWIVAWLMPFAFIEAVSRSPVLLNFFDNIMPSYDVLGSEPRWGLRRAQVVFQHPILFGVFCGIAFAPSVLVLGYGRPPIVRLSRAAVVAGAVFFSLSAGPMTALTLQVALVGWNWLLRGFAGRWKLLWAILGSMYVIFALFSRQSPAEHLINLVAFDKGSAYQRLLIWKYGTQSIATNPVFGVGFGDWVRMAGQTSSVDMFWIISSLRHGILAGVLLGFAFLGAGFMIGLKHGLTESQVRCKTAYLVALAGFFVAGWTVDFWAELYTAFFFMLGSGIWLLTASGKADPLRPGYRSGSGERAARQSVRRSNRGAPARGL